MKYILTILLATFITDPANIGKVNTIKKNAKSAYLSGNYKEAISNYSFLLDSMRVSDEEVKLNLANAYFKANDTIASQQHYQQLVDSKNNSISSRAFQQLGVMNNREGKFEQALSYFKQAIKADPTNDEARYNYEMLKKKLDEKKKQEEQQKDKDQNKDKQEQKDQEKKEQEKKDQEKQDQEKKDQEKKDQEKKDQEKKDQENKEDKSEEQKQEEKDKEEKQNLPPDLEKKLEDMKISPEKARMILEAMKNQEIQYLQQNKRKATKPKDKSKPDW